MPVNLNARLAHDPRDPDVWALMEGIQGNVLKGHGRSNSVHVFIRFKQSAEAVRSVLLPLLGELVTSAARQARQTELHKEVEQDVLFGSFMLAANGYVRLGFPAASLSTLFVEGREPSQAEGLSHPAFSTGMHAARDVLGDVGPWEAEYEHRIDAVLLLAHNSLSELTDAVKVARSALAAISESMFEEWGHVRRDRFGSQLVPVEHFGYADGISQPVFLKSDEPPAIAMDKWNPVEPLAIVLVPDPAIPDQQVFGSYYVFRKLEQNVAGFRAREAAIASLPGMQLSADQVGALAVGRFRDGTPVVLSGAPGHQPARANNFRFDANPKLLGVCPLHAHIRKTNPRGDTVGPDRDDGGERLRRIVRRGMPYGEASPLGPHPSAGVGLLFSCYQASIAQQFALIQNQWANQPGFSAATAGPDGLIGPPQTPQTWPRAYGSATTQQLSFGQFVTPLGGEFFFAPSMAFLSRLAPA